MQGRVAAGCTGLASTTGGGTRYGRVSRAPEKGASQVEGTDPILNRRSTAMYPAAS